MTRKTILFTLAMCAASVSMMAQNRAINQERYPMGFDNNFFGVFYYNNNDIFTVKGNQLFSGKPVADLKYNPANTSLAVLEVDKKGAARVSIYDINPSHRLTDHALRVVKMKDANPTAIAFSANAKELAIASSDKKISFIDAITNKDSKQYMSNIAAKQLVYSDNNYFLAAAEGKTLELWNLERGTIRKTMTMDADIRDVCFTKGSETMEVLTADSKLNIYDTKQFDLLYTVDDLGQALACWPSDNGKYAGVVCNPNLISVINVLDPTERHMLQDNNGGISELRMLFHDVRDKNYAIYNNTRAIVYREVEGLTPYYNKMMTSMLNERLNQWMKQMPGESMEDYQLRVNETTRMEQARAIESEIATKMATGLLEQSEVTIGDYNTATKSLALKFNSMPDIFIGVPIDEVSDFTDATKLEFRNAKYGLNPDDKFELIYAEVYNPATGKTYIFDNMERRSLAKMNEDADFVPLEIIQKSNMEETALVGIKEDIFNTAKQENVISDKTHIFVKTEAVNAVNADGQKIVNYNVDFTYEVEEEFSARDDFKPGHYHVEESSAAMLMLKIMTKAFENDFAKYIAQGKRVRIKVKGTADASPINRALAYDGKYGEFDGEPVYKNDELSNITLNKKEGMATNEQLAFARALGVKNYIENEISGLGDMQRDYEYHIEVAKEAGSQFRRISVQYTFIDAF